MNSKKLNQFCISFMLFNLICLLVRMYYTQSFAYRFLIWNTVLAYLPFVFSMRIIKNDNENKLKFYALLLAWILFLPNAPYIITDIIHLGKGKAIVPKWYDAMLLFSHALCGFAMGIASIYLVNEKLKTKWSKTQINLFAMATSLLIGFGIYLGRFLRWNSWDIITNPFSLLHESLLIASHPLKHPKMIVVVLFFGSLHFLVVRLINSVKSNRHIC